MRDVNDLDMVSSKQALDTVWITYETRCLRDELEGVSMAKPRIIIADPPWSFTTWSDKAQKSALRHYSTMTTADIAALPVSKVAADDAMLLLWGTWPNLADIFTVGAGWGFTYKTLGFLWVKTTSGGKLHTGLGYYSRSNSEACFLFTRGNVNRTWIKSHSISQIIEEDDRQHFLPGFEETVKTQVLSHSTKPDTFYKNVEKLVDGPYLELFARRTRANWLTLGNAITGNDIREDLAALAA